MEMKQTIQRILADSVAVKQSSIAGNAERLCLAATRLAGCLAAGGKILVFGNGGSAADAQHLAAEFVNRFQLERRPLGPALHRMSGTPGPGRTLIRRLRRSDHRDP